MANLKMCLTQQGWLTTLEQFKDYKTSFKLPGKYQLWKRVYWAFNRYAGFIWFSFKAFFAQINAVQPTARHAREADEMRAATSECLYVNCHYYYWPTLNRTGRVWQILVVLSSIKYHNPIQRFSNRYVRTDRRQM